MSGFQSQFALSLELTKIAPPIISVAGKTWAAATQFARELQGSGSDIVIEEDLALLFGRNSISPMTASTFRTVVARGGDSSPLIGGITLFSGQGPTVTRALTEKPQGAYFSTVVQCSLLVAVHDVKDLAASLSKAIEKETEGAPSGQFVRSPPSIEGVRGTLTAVNDQTNSFKWHSSLLAVAHQLEVDSFAIHETIPSSILQGLVVMLGSVQRFPEERMLLIETSRAACVLVVWAHHILGLSVLVKRSTENGERIIKFGPEPQQVVIDVAVHTKTTEVSVHTGYTRRPESATLLSADKEELFRLQADPDDEYINSTFRGPARGLGKRVIERELRNQVESIGRLQAETMSLSLALALSFCRKAMIVKSANKQSGLGFAVFDWVPGEESSDQGSTADTEPPGIDYENAMKYEIAEEKLREAAKFLFADAKFSLQNADDYARNLFGGTLQNVEMPPGTIITCMNNLEQVAKKSLQGKIRQLAVAMSALIYAFAHVSNLTSCGELPVVENLSVLYDTTAFKTIAAWKLDSDFESCEDDSFQLISSLMLGGTSEEIDMSLASLACSAGWSVFLSSITPQDPALVEKGSVCIKKGAPWRFGVYKHFILDANPATSDYLTWTVKDGPGNTISLDPVDKVTNGKPYCGERGDSFLVSLRMIHNTTAPDGSETDLIRRTGFRERFAALWNAQTTRSCSHLDGGPREVPLPIDCVVLSGFGDHGAAHTRIHQQVRICPTGGNSNARWRALLSISTYVVGSSPYHPVLLRSKETCLQCALHEALCYPIIPCYLIL